MKNKNIAVILLHMNLMYLVHYSVPLNPMNRKSFFLFNWIQLDLIGLKNCISYSEF